MKIVGCDLHTRYQQLAMLDTGTGELIERRLEHAKGEARAFYAELQGPMRVGIEATGRVPQVRPAFGLTWVPSRDGISKPTVSTVGTQRQIPLHSAEGLRAGRRPKRSKGCGPHIPDFGICGAFDFRRRGGYLRPSGRARAVLSATHDPLRHHTLP